MKKIIVLALLCATIHSFSPPDINVEKLDLYTIRSGDTLWDIAVEMAPEGIDKQRYINLLYRYNDELTSEIKPGQVIYIPVVKG